MDRLTNRITHLLKEYFPQVLQWFRDKETAVFADFIERWPTLVAAQRARSETLVAFFHAHNVCVFRPIWAAVPDGIWALIPADLGA